MVTLLKNDFQKEESRNIDRELALEKQSHKVAYKSAFKDTLRKLKGKVVVNEAVTYSSQRHPKLANYNYVLSSTGVSLLTSASGSQPQGNTKKDRIQQTQSRAKKNKLEDHPMTVRHSLHNKKSVVNTKAISSVPNSNLNGLLRGGLGHNLFSVGQFCYSDLEVAFRQHTCFIHNLDGVDMLTGSRGNNLYTLSLRDMTASSPICLLSKASKTKSWLWHRRLSHPNFGAINHLARQCLVRGLPKLKFEKDHLCSACAMGKSKNKSQKPKSEDTNQEKLYLLHMDLYGPMRVESVNGKKYILVIVDDYSRFTWVKCLRSKDEAPDFIIKFLKMIQV
nr:retrovirus-related Pol polyprotein from transposon TNT 1-94 [Tanacetum cinerariifolium]